jgi:hypothetical protein
MIGQSTQKIIVKHTGQNLIYGFGTRNENIKKNLG